MKKNLILSTLLFICGTMSLKAAEFYIMYDQTCMSEFVYKNNTGIEEIKYYLQIDEDERILLETAGLTTARIQSYLPRQAFRCGNSFINENLTQILQNNYNQVYLVKPQPNNQYQIIQIRAYDYYLQDGTYTVYNGQQYRFQFSPSLATVGQDLSSNDPRGMVRFEGRISYSCAEALIFRQTVNLQSNSYIDIVFIPEIGVVEQRGTQLNNTSQLIRINGEGISSYLQRFCNNNGSATAFNQQTLPQQQNPSVSSYGNTGFGTANATTTNTFGNQNIANTNTNTANYKYHTVQKKETLYSISKKYNLEVAQLRRLNNMAPNETMIRAGANLVVGYDNNPPSSQFVTSFDQSNQINSYNTGSNVFDTRGSSAGLTKAWQTNTTGTHVVRPGESVEDIAIAYGFTPERFRTFNNLNANARVNPGDVLKVTDCDTPVVGTIGQTNPQQITNPSSIVTPQDVFGNQNQNNPTNPATVQPQRPQKTADDYFYLGQENSNVNDLTGRGNDVQTGDDFQPYSIFNEETSKNTNPTNPGSSAAPYNFNVSPSNGSSLQSPTPPSTRTDNSGKNFGTLLPENRPSTFNSPVPGGGNVSSSTVPNTNSAPSTGRVSHTVKRGDTPSSIAKQYGLPLNQILRANNIKRRTKLNPGQTIYLN